jgi:hypothetical protein
LSQYAFVNITQADSIITFNVVEDNSKISIEDFERMPVGATLYESDVQGVYAKWNFYNCAVVDTAQVGNGHVAAMKSGSYMYTSDFLNKIPSIVRIKIYNPTSSGVFITPQYFKSSGTRWQGLDYPYQFYAAAGATTTAIIANLPTNEPIKLRLNASGSSEYFFIDDIEICYENTWEPEEPEYQLGDVNRDGFINVSDVTMLISMILNSADYDAIGDMDGSGNLNVVDVTALIAFILNM